MFFTGFIVVAGNDHNAGNQTIEDVFHASKKYKSGARIGPAEFFVTVITCS
jgi:hypothetical protein